VPEGVFGGIYLIGLIAASAIRARYGVRYRRSKIEHAWKEGLAVSLLMFLWGAAQVVAVLYVLTPWLAFADYHLPVWAGLVGAAIYVPGVWLLWRSHADLGRNWSPGLEITEGHALVSHGVFCSVRHPMYAAHGLWAIGQALLLHNWVAGFASLVAFAPLYLLRVPREERMMLDHFGQQYRSYMDRTGRVIPLLRR